MKTKTDEANDDALTKMRTQVESFMESTEGARQMSERDRDYVDHKQWTSAEIAKLTGRHQAPIVVNRIKPKVDGLLGLVEIRKTDPKAYPRTDKHEKSAEAITDGLRFVTDNNDFPTLKSDVAENFFVEGYGGVDIKVRRKGKEIIICIDQLPWDRIYFDPFCRKRDFSDARFKGYMQWLGEDELLEKFQSLSAEKLDEVINSATFSYSQTFEDRPRWVDKKTKRVLVAFHYYKHKGQWWFCAFTDGLFLIEPMVSPYLDDDGEPACTMELVGAYIDRDNNRYGEVRGYIGQQDEMNHRRSKFLHMLSTRQTFGNKKAGIDIKDAKRELAKPNGHLELKDGEFNKDFGVLPTGDMAQGQFELYQDAKAELDAVGVNAQMAGERQEGTLSGVAINKLQQAGAIELNRLFMALNGWEKRVYRQIWSRIKQFWTEEKWIRVTDDINTLRWVGLNAQVTTQEWLEETINDKSLPEVVRKQASASYIALMQTEDPLLNKVIEVRNNVPEIMVDIILEQSFDVVNIQQEQFEMLAKFATPGSGIDIIDLIDLSQIRGKDQVIERIKKTREQQAQAAGGAQNLAAQHAQAKTAETASKAALNTQSAVQKQIENTMLISQPPDPRPQINA